MAASAVVTAPAQTPAARLRQIGADAHDPQRWKDFGYLTLFSMVGFVTSLVWAMLWGCVLVGLTMPAWWWSTTEAEYLSFTINSWEEALGAAAIGVALLPVAVLIQRPLALAQAGLARTLLG